MAVYRRARLTGTREPSSSSACRFPLAVALERTQIIHRSGGYLYDR